jgi:hypothetical protein
MFRKLLRAVKRAFSGDPSQRLVNKAANDLRSELTRLTGLLGQLPDGGSGNVALNRIGYARSRYAIMGVRSHGKTTVVSALTKQRLLPSDGPPITAFPCLISRSTERDSWAEVFLKSGSRRTISANRKTLEQWVALTTEDGRPNRRAELCERLSLYVAPWPLDDDLEILDVQGDDDRASVVVSDKLPLEVDVVVYVVRMVVTPVADGITIQGRNEFHNEDFIARLRSLMAIRGAAGVKLVINIFFPSIDRKLQDETGDDILRSEWQRHLEKTIPLLRSALSETFKGLDLEEVPDTFFVAAGPAEAINPDSFGFAELRAALQGEARRASTAKSRSYVIQKMLAEIIARCNEHLPDRRAWEARQAAYSAAVHAVRSRQEEVDNRIRRFIARQIDEDISIIEKAASNIIDIVEKGRRVPHSGAVLADIETLIRNQQITAQRIAKEVARTSERNYDLDLLEEEMFDIISVRRVSINFTLPSEWAYWVEGIPFTSKAEEARRNAASNIRSQIWRIKSHWRRAKSSIFDHVQPLIQMAADLPGAPPLAPCALSASEITALIDSARRLSQSVQSGEAAIGPG